MFSQLSVAVNILNLWLHEFNYRHDNEQIFYKQIA